MHSVSEEQEVEDDYVLAIEELLHLIGFHRQRRTVCFAVAEEAVTN